MEENCGMLLIKYNNLVDEYNNAVRFEKYGGDVEKGMSGKQGQLIEMVGLDARIVQAEKY